MQDDTSIQHAIATLQLQLTAAEQRAEKIRQAISVLRELLPSDKAPVASKPTAPAGKGTARFRGITMGKAAAIVLSEAHQPLHVSKIMERMLDGGFKPGTPDNFRLSLVGSLDRGARDDDPKGWFYKPEPATYALREWQTSGAGHNGNGQGGD
jgi:hypothetical protein